MNRNRTVFRATAVLGAAAVVIALAASLATRAADRVAGDERARAPGLVAAPVEPAAIGRVPEPKPLTLKEVPKPRCWSCPANNWERIDFELDLDHLAPLGDGSSNAALWLAGFAKTGDPPEPGRPYHVVQHEVGGTRKRGLAFDDPILAEAEAWVTQGTCRFYPDVWKLEGFATRIPNLLFALDVAKTWVLRGRQAEDRVAAVEDYRRAVRLGRLLYEEDATLIQHLVAIAIVRLGVEALHDEARAQGDVLTVAAAGTVLADVDAMRSRAAARVSRVTSVWEGVRTDFFGRLRMDATDEQVESALELVRKSKDPRFRFEALTTLRALLHYGSDEHAELARVALEEVAAESNAQLAEQARLALEQPFSDEELALLKLEAAD